MRHKAFSFARSQIRYLIRFLPGSPFRRLRNLLWRQVGFAVSPASNLTSTAVLICGDISIGAGTFIGDEVMITGGEIIIGKNCDVAPRVVIHAGSHRPGNHNRRAGEAYSGKIIIGDGSWVGTGSIILEGAVIGKGTVIAAGSVVTSGMYGDDVMLAGVPAKVKKILANDTEDISIDQ